MPVTASTEEIEAAWRVKQRKHHPDVAGNTPEANKVSQLINVARDWLTDPEMRDYYDAERGIASPGAGTRREPPPPSRQRRTHPSFDPWSAEYGPNQTAVREFLRRVAALTPDECERLSASSPPSIAGLRRFLPPDLAAAFDRLEQAIDALLPMPDGLPHRLARLALLAAGFEILAGDWLDREIENRRDREYLRALALRVWERATKEPRYGRRHADVKAIVERLARLSDTEAASLLRAHKPEEMSDGKWFLGSLPRGLTGDDLTSYTVASSDGESAVPAGLVAPELEPRLRLVAGRTAGLAALADSDPELAAASAEAWRYATDAPYRETQLRLRRRARAVIAVVVVAGALVLLLVPALRGALILGALALWIGLGILSWLAAKGAAPTASQTDNALRRE